MIALLLAVSAIVAPSMVGVLRDRALESAAAVVSEQMMLARAHAQSSGQSIEVLYRHDPPRIVARRFTAGSEAIGEGERRAAELRREEDPFAGGDQMESDADDDDVLTWSWARRALPAGVRVRPEPPETPRQHNGFDGARLIENEITEGDVDTEQRPIRLAVFLPDGSALFGSPVWLSMENGRTLKLGVNLWTGLTYVEEHISEPNDRDVIADVGGRFP